MLSLKNLLNLNLLAISHRGREVIGRELHIITDKFNTSLHVYHLTILSTKELSYNEPEG